MKNHVITLCVGGALIAALIPAKAAAQKVDMDFSWALRQPPTPQPPIPIVDDGSLRARGFQYYLYIRALHKQGYAGPMPSLQEALKWYQETHNRQSSGDDCPLHSMALEDGSSQVGSK